MPYTDHMMKERNNGMFYNLGYNTRHGGPYDRGSADFYYHRPRDPHYFIGATYSSERISAENMTKEEIAAYNAGYDSCTEQKEFYSER